MSDERYVAWVQQRIAETYAEIEAIRAEEAAQWAMVGPRSRYDLQQTTDSAVNDKLGRIANWRRELAAAGVNDNG